MNDQGGSARFGRCSLIGLALALTLVAVPRAGLAEPVGSDSVPRIVSANGNHALLVDGEPYLMLGAQAHNSSNYPEPLKKVWPVLRVMGANTLEIPVAWEQVEPREDQFDFSWLDTLIAEARQNQVRLVLLWFGAWKNTNPNYSPSWVKLDNNRFPRMINAKGETHYALTPNHPAIREADRRAFVRMMEYLRDHDRANTVIMVQVENEPGSYGLVRDHSPLAEKQFAGPVPAALCRKMACKGRTWREAYGKDADEYFQAWSIASHIEALAAAGKAVKPLPMYANAALASAFGRQDAATYASGGPVHHVIDVYKAAAPSLDLVAPDIYARDEKAIEAYLGFYDRPDNPLFVPEIANDQPFARFFYSLVGRGGIGFAPFGMDGTDYSNHPLGAKKLEDSLPLFARSYRLFAPMQRIWARAAAAGKTWGAAELSAPEAGHKRELDLGRYKVTIGFGHDQFGMDPPRGNPEPTGGVAIAELGPDDYLVTGFDARVSFAFAQPEPGRTLMLVRVEEGHFEGDRWVFERVWNGDQTDYGLNLNSNPHVLRVKLGSYRGKPVVPVGQPN